MFTALRSLYALLVLATTASAIFSSYVSTNFVVLAAPELRVITGTPMNDGRGKPSFQAQFLIAMLPSGWRTQTLLRLWVIVSSSFNPRYIDPLPLHIFISQYCRFG